ncbi:MAG: PP2C family protein-serine/threonine phosphatase [Bryobacteraceae bacterium]
MAAAEGNVIREILLDRRARLQSARTTITESDDLARLLREVDGALDRMERGTYGLCEVCYGAIEHDRLLADPLTCVCLDDLDDHQRRALEHDLEMAPRIQAGLLPPRRLAASGWEAYYYYQPAGAVSGDYCDAVPLDGGLFFLTADVSGKGVSAALLMTHLHAVYRSLLPLGLPLPELMDRANRVFSESTLATHYATLVCGIARPSGEVELCNAGHCPPLLVRGDGVVRLEAASLPLGIFRAAHFPSTTVRVDAGDALVLYTDGVTEARDAADQEYGMLRLTEAAERARGQGSEDMAEMLLTNLDRFLDGAPKTDDVTLMVVGRR